MVYFRQKIYSGYDPRAYRYDRTDQLKQMKDSDILAEEQRPTDLSNKFNVGQAALAGAGIGATIGAFQKKDPSLWNKTKSKFTGKTPTSSGTKWKGKAVKGALIGTGLAIAGNMVKDMTKTKEEQAREDANKFYNQRLQYAQKQAMRRESRDWKNNMVNRTDYTY